MEWFRLYGEFATDPKVQSMPEVMQRRLIMVFCLKCSNVLVTLQETDICFALRIDDEQLAETKALFIRKNFIDEDWNVLQWDERQKPSDSSAPRVRAFRERKKQESEAIQKHAGNVTETPQSRREERREEEKKEPKAKADARASRLPKDWEPSDIDMAFIRKERPELDARKVASQFRDYWVAKAGKDGAKADWAATWRNWVRNQRQQYGGGGGTNFNDDRRRVMDELTGRGRHAAIDDINIIDI